MPGDLMLDELHVVLQVAMGWEDGHLHKFGVGVDRRARAYFVTEFDLSEGDEGIAEDDTASLETLGRRARTKAATSADAAR